MKTFKGFMKEETMPYANVKSGVMDISDSAVRDQINQLLAGVTNMKFVTPYIALERVAKTLANFHIFLPNQGFLEGDSGAATWPIHQYGAKIGQTNDGEVVTTPAAQFHVFFEYRMSDCGMYMVFCEVVDQDELDEIMNDLEAELNDEGEGEEEELDEESGYYYGKQPVSELKMSDEQQLDEISAEKVGKLKKAVDLEGKKLKTDKAKETLRTVHKKKWLASNVGVMKEDEQLDEVSDKLKARYVKKAEKDKADAERQASHAEYSEKHAQPERKKDWKNEAEWLRGVAAKRAKGIASAKK